MTITGRQITRRTWSLSLLNDLRNSASSSAKELRQRMEKTNPYVDKRKHAVFAPAAELAVNGLEKRSEKIGRHVDALDEVMQKIQDYCILKKGSPVQQEAYGYLLSKLEYMWQLLANGKLKEFISEYQDVASVPRYAGYLPKRMVLAAEKMVENKALSRLMDSVKLTESMYPLE